ncbi:MAG: DUF5103 domain-containing protein [Bacteroidaceae bacterium]
MKRYSSILMFFILVVFPSKVVAQEQRVFDETVRTLQVCADGNPTLPPWLDRNKRQHVEVSWDQMSHEYQRYVYYVYHCDADWQVSDGIFESDWLAGSNGQPVEDYEKSFNTTQIYTHYSLTIPNKDVGVLLSGNYMVRVYRDDDTPEEDEPVLEARFCVYENSVSISQQVSSNTDIDFNDRHQQLTLHVGYGSLRVIDPLSEFRVMVLQNRRWDSIVTGLKPNERNAAGMDFTHNKQLIFPAGNEFHRFEILDVQRAAAGVDRMEWYDPFYHATLFSDRPARNYSFVEDQNGVRVVRSPEDGNESTTAEYVVVHFLLGTPRLSGGDIYVCGLWTGQSYNPECRMEYDEQSGQYHAAVMLKQGYYSYQYRQEDGSTRLTEGDFFETENEYTTMVYYRAQGARYDRLVGVSSVKTGRR